MHIVEGEIPIKGEAKEISDRESKSNTRGQAMEHHSPIPSFKIVDDKMGEMSDFRAVKQTNM